MLLLPQLNLDLQLLLQLHQKKADLGGAARGSQNGEGGWEGPLALERVFCSLARSFSSFRRLPPRLVKRLGSVAFFYREEKVRVSCCLERQLSPAQPGSQLPRAPERDTSFSSTCGLLQTALDVSRNNASVV